MTNKYLEALSSLESVSQYHKSIEGAPPIRSYGRETLKHIDAILEALRYMSNDR